MLPHHVDVLDRRAGVQHRTRDRALRFQRDLRGGGARERRRASRDEHHQACVAHPPGSRRLRHAEACTAGTHASRVRQRMSCAHRLDALPDSRPFGCRVQRRDIGAVRRDHEAARHGVAEGVERARCHRGRGLADRDHVHARRRPRTRAKQRRRDAGSRIELPQRPGECALDDSAVHGAGRLIAQLNAGRDRRDRRCARRTPAAMRRSRAGRARDRSALRWCGHRAPSRSSARLRGGR